MKALLGFLGLLGVLLCGAMALSPAGPRGVMARLTGYFSIAPRAAAAVEGGAAPTDAGAASPPAAVPEWRRQEREAVRLFEEARFEEAAAAYRRASALKGVPSRDAVALRSSGDRCRLYALLDAAVPRTGPTADAGEEYLRRARGATSGAAYLDTAAFAAARGLRTHLPWLYERAWELRNDGEAAFAKALAEAYRAARTLNSAGPGREVAAAVLRELPSGEAADMAREDTGGIGGVEDRGSGGDAERDALLEEARRLKREGDREYRLAVPGSEGVNAHRRAALDQFTKSREIFEEVKRKTGRTAWDDVIHDLNRNIAEIRKDLPVGK